MPPQRRSFPVQRPNTSSQPTPTPMPNSDIKQRPSRPVAQRQGPQQGQFRLDRIKQQKTQDDSQESPFLNALKRRRTKR